jgi:hypothetical protein
MSASGPMSAKDGTADRSTTRERVPSGSGASAFRAFSAAFSSGPGLERRFRRATAVNSASVAASDTGRRACRGRGVAPERLRPRIGVRRAYTSPFPCCAWRCRVPLRLPPRFFGHAYPGLTRSMTVSGRGCGPGPAVLGPVRRPRTGSRRSNERRCANTAVLRCRPPGLNAYVGQMSMKLGWKTGPCRASSPRTRLSEKVVTTESRRHACSMRV